MSQDHYAILGVTPTAQPAAIRAAYLGLMREYHPDRNPSPVAAERARAIVAAYKVLGDFDRRQEYDWDQRRAREAAAALAAGPKRRVSAAVAIAGVLGLSIAGAMMLRPQSRSLPPPDRLPNVAITENTMPERRTAPVPPPAIEMAERAPLVMPVPKLEPVEMVPELYPAPEPVPVPVKRGAAKAVVPNPMVRVPMAKVVPVPKLVPILNVVPVAVPKPMAKPIARPVARPPAPTDLAALDQFVMSFYGQSWRFGDARKRAALEQSRSLFVVRRAACAVDTCRRSEYLRLQREVSAIVESGQSR